MKKPFRKGELKRLAEQMGSNKLQYLCGLVGSSIIGAFTSVLMAFVLKDLVDAASEKSMSLLMKAILMAALICLVLCTFIPFFEYMYNAGIRKCMADIRRRVFRHVENLKMSYFEEVHSGEILSGINNKFSRLLPDDPRGLLLVEVTIGYGCKNPISVCDGFECGLFIFRGDAGYSGFKCIKADGLLCFQPGSQRGERRLPCFRRPLLSRSF